jgi:hypothetical protein
LWIAAPPRWPTVDSASERFALSMVAAAVTTATSTTSTTKMPNTTSQ